MVSGPIFLLIYALIAFAANGWLRRHYRRLESGRLPRLILGEDPYRIACLRAGEEEAARLAVFSLIDRGLLLYQGSMLVKARDDAGELVRRDLEKAVLAAARLPLSPDDLLSDLGVCQEAARYTAELGARKLLLDAHTRAARLPALLLCLVLTQGIALARVVQSLLKGRFNIVFLVLLSIVCAVMLCAAYRRRLTAMGQQALGKLEMLFNRLRLMSHTIKPGGHENAAVLLAAVFGFAALPVAVFPWAHQLFVPRGGSSVAGDGGGGDGGDGGGCGSGCGGCGGGCG